MNNLSRYVSITVLFVSLTACASGPLGIHKIPVQQGNALTTEALDSLYEGMSQKEVVSLLGNPVTQPLFNEDRWDYVYISINSRNESERLHVSLTFNDGVVSNIQRTN